MEQYKINFKSIDWQTPMSGIRLKAYEQEGRKLRLAEFSKEFIEPDWCLKGHIGYVLDGRVEINFDGKLITFGPGDGIFIPAGEKHKHMTKVLTDSVTVILVEDT